MLGLILKDIYTMKKQLKIVALISAFYIFFAIAQNEVSFMAYMALFVNLGIAIATFSYDEKSNWEKYARVLPMSFKKMVQSRYVEELVLSALMLAILIPMGILFKQSDKEILEILSIIVAAISAGIVMIAIMYPLIYKVGIEKARIAIFAIILVPAIAMLILGKMNILLTIEKLAENPFVNYISYHLYIICPLIALVLLALSYLISIAVVGKKEY